MNWIETIPIRYRNKLIDDVSQLSVGNVFFDNPWDMECCFKTYRLHKGKIGKTPNGDPEWVFQYCRLEWLNKFTLLYKIIGDCSLLDKWNHIVSVFFANNDAVRNSAKKVPATRTFLRKCLDRCNKILKSEIYPTYRTLDTAIRNYTLVSSIITCPYLEKKYLSDNFRKRLISDSLFTYNNLREFDYTSNWGIIIVTSYLMTNLLLKNYNFDSDPAFKKLQIMLNNQVLDNGAHIESSNMYHNQILLYLLRLLYWSKEYNNPIPEFIAEYAMKMAEYTIRTAGPDKYQIQYGDSDHTSLETIIALSHTILNNKSSLPKIKDPDYILLNEFKYNISCDELKQEKYGDYIGYDGVIKACNENWTVFVYNTKFYSSHKHTDNGQIIIFYKNMPVTIDSGRYSYQANAGREYYKRAEAHNTVLIGEQTLLSDEYNRMVSNIKNTIKRDANQIIIEISFTTHIAEGLGTIKRIIELNSYSLKIEDYFYIEKSNHKIQETDINQYFIIAPENYVNRNGNTYIIKNRKYKISLFNDFKNTELESHFVSSNYNLKKQTIRIKSNDSIIAGQMTKKTTIFKIE